MFGWIKVHRIMRQHWIYKDADYLKAWITILLEANHSDQKILIKGVLLECKRGQSLNSLETWARLFGGWSKSRVKRFFKLLKTDSMIDTTSERITTRLSVCNYEKYQDCGNAESTSDETQTSPQTERRRATNKKVKKVENDKNEIITPEMAENIYQAYPVKKGRKAAIKSILKSLKEIEYETLLEHVQNFAKSVKGKDQQYIKYPATWFNQGCWDDEGVNPAKEIKATPLIVHQNEPPLRN